MTHLFEARIDDGGSYHVNLTPRNSALLRACMQRHGLEASAAFQLLAPKGAMLLLPLRTGARIYVQAQGSHELERLSFVSAPSRRYWWLLSWIPRGRSNPEAWDLTTDTASYLAIQEAAQHEGTLTDAINSLIAVGAVAENELARGCTLWVQYPVTNAQGEPTGLFDTVAPLKFD